MSEGTVLTSASSGVDTKGAAFTTSTASADAISFSVPGNNGRNISASKNKTTPCAAASMTARTCASLAESLEVRQEPAGSGEMFPEASLANLSATATATAKAVAAVANRIHFKVAGSGPLADHLVTLSRQLGLSSRVEFVGPVEASDMPAFLRSLDIVINPCVCEYIYLCGHFGTSFVFGGRELKNMRTTLWSARSNCFSLMEHPYEVITNGYETRRGAKTALR